MKRRASSPHQQSTTTSIHLKYNKDHSATANDGSATSPLGVGDLFAMTRSSYETSSSADTIYWRPNYEGFLQPGLTTNQRRRSNSLPTLEESSSSGSDDYPSFHDIADQHSQLRDLEGLEKSVNPAKSDSTSTKSFNIGGGKLLGYKERLHVIQEKALLLAQMGREQKALGLYKKALLLCNYEIKRVKNQKKQIESKHEKAVQSIKNRLLEDWLTVGLAMAKLQKLRAVLYDRGGDYGHALACYREARKIYSQQLRIGARNIWLKRVEQLAREIDAMIEKLEQANSSYTSRKEWLTKVISLRQKASTTEDHKEENELLAIAVDVATELGRLEVIALGDRHPQVADTFLILAELSCAQNDQLAALEYMIESLTINELALGRTHPRLAHDLAAIGSVYADRSHNLADVTLALQYFNSAVDVLKKSNSEPATVGSMLNEIALIHIARKDFPLSTQILEEALNCFTSASKLSNAFEMEIALVWRNIGESLMHQKLFQKALDAYVHALDLQREARRRYDLSNNQSYLESNIVRQPLLVTDASIADTLRRLSKAFQGLQRYNEALAALHEAKVIHRIEVFKARKKANEGSPINLSLKEDQLANTLFCIAEVYSDSGDYRKAANQFSKSLQLRLFSDAHRDGDRSNMIHVAMCLVGMGTLHERKAEFAEAYNVFVESASYCEGAGVSSDHPIYCMITRKITETEQHKTVFDGRRRSEIVELEERAEAEIQRGELDLALSTLTRVLAIRRVSLRRLPSNGKEVTSKKFAAACTMQKFGSVLLQKGDLLHAEQAYQNSLDLFRQTSAHTRCRELENILASMVER